MSYPTEPKFIAINFASREYQLASESITGRTQIRSLNSQRWEFSASYTNIKSEDFLPVSSFVMAQRGRATPFTIVLPTISDPKGTIAGTMQTNATGALGDTSIAVDTFTGEILAGSMIKFNGHSKVYMVTSDRDGAGTLNFMPALVDTVENDEVIQYSSVPFTVRLSNSIQRYTLGNYDFVNYEVDFAEVI